MDAEDLARRIERAAVNAFALRAIAMVCKDTNYAGDIVAAIKAILRALPPPDAAGDPS